jgi:crotonobetainyl-CoA:carnitine CoA-transferase CaiB-like acyl-CoA transferase
LEAAFAMQPADEWVQRLRGHGIAAQRRVPVAELMQDPYVRKRGLSVSQEVEGVGETTTPGLPVTLSRTPMRVGDPPRQPGSDAPAILDELGMSEQLAKLEKAWVLQVHDLNPAWGAAM